MNAKNNKQGFTLIEVMIVIAIMGILATIAVPNTIGVIERVRENIDKLKLFYLREALNRTLIETETALFDSPYLTQGNADEQKKNRDNLTKFLKAPSGVNIFVLELKPGQPANIQGSHGQANNNSNMTQLVEHGGTWYYALKEAGFEGVADIVALRWDAEETYSKTSVKNGKEVQEDVKIGLDSLFKRDGKNGKVKEYDNFSATKDGSNWRTYPKTPVFISRELNYGKMAGLAAISSQGSNRTNYRLTLSVQYTNRDPNSRSVEVALIPNGAKMNDGGHGGALRTDHGVCFSTYGDAGCADYKY